MTEATEGAKGLECLEDYGRGDCAGPVAYHATPGARAAFPRCARHWEQRMDRWENSIERYADSPLPPDWFDPSYAGEKWEDD